MTQTISVRVDKEVAEWLQDTSARTGIPKSRIVRDQLEKAMNEKWKELRTQKIFANRSEKPWMKSAGSVSGAPDLSQRKGYSPQ